RRGPSVLRPVGRGRLVGTAFMVDRIALGVVEGGGGFSGSGSRRAPSLYPSRFPSRQCVVEGPPPLCNRRLVAWLPWPTFSGCRPLPAQLVARQWKHSGGCLGGRVPRREPRCSAPSSVLGRIRCAELDTRPCARWCPQGSALPSVCRRCGRTGVAPCPHFTCQRFPRLAMPGVPCWTSRDRSPAPRHQVPESTRRN